MILVALTLTDSNVQASSSAWSWVAGQAYLLATGTHVLSIWQDDAGASADRVARAASATPLP